MHSFDFGTDTRLDCVHEEKMKFRTTFTLILMLTFAPFVHLFGRSMKIIQVGEASALTTYSAYFFVILGVVLMYIGSYTVLYLLSKKGFLGEKLEEMTKEKEVK